MREEAVNLTSKWVFLRSFSTVFDWSDPRICFCLFCALHVWQIEWTTRKHVFFFLPSQTSSTMALWLGYMTPVCVCVPFQPWPSLTFLASSPPTLFRPFMFYLVPQFHSIVKSCHMLKVYRLFINCIKIKLWENSRDKSSLLWIVLCSSRKPWVYELNNPGNNNWAQVSDKITGA